MFGTAATRQAAAGAPPHRGRVARGAVALVAVATLGAAPLARPAVATPVAACGTGTLPTVTALQDTHYYMDTSVTPVLDSHYAGYRVANPAGGTALTNAYVALSGFAGSDGSTSLITLAPSQRHAEQVGPLAATRSGVRYFLLKASAVSGKTTPTQVHTISVYDGNPDCTGSRLVCTTTFTY